MGDTPFKRSVFVCQLGRALLYFPHMRATTAVRLLFGATLLVAGFGVLTDEPPTKGALVQAVTGAFDMKDRQCRHAPTAVGAACPAGCVARPAASADGRSAPTECHSALWIATCGKACAPAAGFARLPDGRLADAGSLVVTLNAEPDDAFRRALSSMGVSLTPRFDGLDRYDAAVPSGKIQQTKKRLSALPQVVSAEFVPR